MAIADGSKTMRYLTGVAEIIISLLMDLLSNSSLVTENSGRLDKESAKRMGLIIYLSSSKRN